MPLFRDFREMFDKAGSTFDAAIIATPDHAHFPVAVHAMRHGKHVYVEKPVAQSFREVDLLMALARQTGVVTQMGNQGHSGNNYFQFKAWTKAGIINDVTKIVAFMNSERRWHGWKVDGFPSGEATPPGLDWDVWNAARPVHPYSARLHPQTWRGWFTYGTGAFGDWGAHILDTAHQFLDLGLPHTIEAVHRDQPSDFIFPQATTIRFDFAARGPMPPVEVFWYDGVNNRPPLPTELGHGATLTEREGKFIYSKDLVFKGGTHGETLRIIPEERMKAMAASLPTIVGGFSDHATNFVRACQGKEETRSPFNISGPLTQVFLLGIVAQRLGGRLEFDTQRREFSNNAEANRLLHGLDPRPGWESFYTSSRRESLPRLGRYGLGWGQRAEKGHELPGQLRRKDPSVRRHSSRPPVEDRFKHRRIGSTVPPTSGDDAGRPGALAPDRMASLAIHHAEESFALLRGAGIASVPD